MYSFWLHSKICRCNYIHWKKNFQNIVTYVLHPLFSQHNSYMNDIDSGSFSIHIFFYLHFKMSKQNFKYKQISKCNYNVFSHIPYNHNLLLRKFCKGWCYTLYEEQFSIFFSWLNVNHNLKNDIVASQMRQGLIK